MLRNHLKLFFRQFKKRPLNSIVNILGLAIGLAVCGLIGMYIANEMSVDQFHTKGERIYRVNSWLQTPNGEVSSIPTVGRPVALTIAEEVPEIEKVVPMHRYGAPILHEQKRFYEEVYFAGEHFFEVFSFPLLEGTPATALKEPYTVVLTESIKKKFFGDEPALGKTLIMGDSTQYRVTGVVQDPPPTHLELNVLASVATYYAMDPDLTQWFTLDGYCYVLLGEETSYGAAAAKMENIPMEKAGDMFKDYGYICKLELDPLEDIYLNAKASYGMKPGGDLERLKLLGMIALFVLLIGCINFINLTTAQTVERAKEIGIRKTIGASRWALIGQTLSEALLLVVISSGVAALLMDLGLPLFNDLTDETLSMHFFLQKEVWPAILLFLLLTGLLAGIYPAVAQARLRPVESLKGQYREGKGGGNLRKVLVVAQFGISIVLVISTIVVFRQLGYMQNQELGFNQEQMLVINARKTPRKQFIENYETLKQELQSVPGVEKVAGTTAIPGRMGWGGQVVRPEGVPEDMNYNMEVIPSDHDYVSTLGLTIKAGRDFSEVHSTDSETGVLLNEKACEVFGWQPEEAIGRKIWTAGRDGGVVVGVLENYHQHGLQREINATVNFISTRTYRYVMMRLNTSNLQSSIQSAKAVWDAQFPGYPFDYQFLDDAFNEQYQAEARLSRTFGIFALLGILTACLGLFGLSVFMAEKRTKEIGIRKVLGATVQQVVALLSKDFLKLVLIAILLGAPVAWYLMSRWLENFAYHINVQWWMLLLAGGLALAIALLTVSIHAIRAAVANPIEALRDE